MGRAAGRGQEGEICHHNCICQDMRPKGATQSWRMACKLQAMSMHAHDYRLPPMTTQAAADPFGGSNAGCAALMAGV